MRILHTADWHLGHRRIIGQEREEEQQAGLQWLLQTIKEQQIDALLVAGDIFDIGNPPAYARQQYYQFLAGLIGTSCKTVVVTAGNHDSPSQLEAGAELLRHLQIHVIGSMPEDVDDLLIPLTNMEGNVEAVVAAIPYLRERDLPKSDLGDDLSTRTERLREGIRNVYAHAAQRMQVLYPQVPHMATGHLYARGAKADGKNNIIYLGDLENISAEAFPPSLAYVALGHIHQPQKVGGFEHIRYSGSLLNMDFSEAGETKTVVLITLSDDSIAIESIPVPEFRLMRRFRGVLKQVEIDIANLVTTAPTEALQLRPWIETWLEQVDLSEPALAEWKRRIEDQYQVDLLVRRSHVGLDIQHLTQALQTKELSEWTPLEVFERRLALEGTHLQEDEKRELVALFNELSEKVISERE